MKRKRLVNIKYIEYVELTRSAAPKPVFEDGIKELGSGATLSPSA